jgi:hypothetical protein
MMSQEVIERHSDSSHFHRIYLNDQAYLSIEEPGEQKGKEKVKGKEKEKYRFSRSRSLSVKGVGVTERRMEGEIEAAKEKEEEIPFEEMWIFTRQQMEQQQHTGCLFASSPYQ